MDNGERRGETPRLSLFHGYWTLTAPAGDACPQDLIPRVGAPCRFFADCGRVAYRELAFPASAQVMIFGHDSLCRVIKKSAAAGSGDWSDVVQRNPVRGSGQSHLNLGQFQQRPRRRVSSACQLRILRGATFQGYGQGSRRDYPGPGVSGFGGESYPGVHLANRVIPRVTPRGSGGARSRLGPEWVISGGPCCLRRQPGSAKG